MKKTLARLTIACVSLIIIGLMFAGQSVARIDPKSYAGVWLFDEDKGDIATDSSGNKNDGTIKNAKWVDGKFGKALKFDGASTFVDCGNEASLDITEEISVMAWVQFDGLDYKNSSGLLHTIAAKGYPDALAPHAGWWFSYDNRNNKQDFPYTCFGKKAGGWAGGGNNLSGHPSTFKDREWYHFAFTIGESIAALYIDGTQLGAEKPLVDLVLSDLSRNLTIGSAGTSWWFRGIIDEVAIFNIKLEEKNIQTIMDKGLSSTAVGLSGKLVTTWAAIKTH